MKVFIHKHLDFFSGPCKAIEENRKEYCERYGYELYVDTIPPDRNRHWSFCYIDSILRAFEEYPNADFFFPAIPGFIIMDMTKDHIQSILLENDRESKYDIVAPVFTMFYPEHPYMIVNMRGIPKKVPTTDPIPYVLPSAVIIRNTERSYRFFRAMAKDRRFTSGYFKELPPTVLAVGDAMTIYCLGYKGHRKYIKLYDGSHYTAMPIVSYPKHLDHLNNGTMKYFDPEDPKPIVYIVGCGYSHTTAMELIEAHLPYIRR